MTQHTLHPFATTDRQREILAANDAYASKGGWISGREAKVITYHRDHRHVGSVVITPEMAKKGGLLMGAPVFKVAVRDDAGQAVMFRVSHSTIQSHEQVLALVREELPDAKVILVGIG